MKKYIPVLIFLILTLLWVGFIWGNSAKSGEESGAASSGVMAKLEDVCDFLGIDMPLSERAIRKTAHFCEYLVLSLLLCTDVLLILKERLSLKCRKNLLFLLTAPTLCALVALIDEFVVQAMSIGRGPSFVDVLIDTSGATVGMLIYGTVLFIILSRRAHREKDVSESCKLP